MTRSSRQPSFTEVFFHANNQSIELVDFFQRFLVTSKGALVFGYFAHNVMTEYDKDKELLSYNSDAQATMLNQLHEKIPALKIRRTAWLFISDWDATELRHLLAIGNCFLFKDWEAQTNPILSRRFLGSQEDHNG
jgi:hypothetical protein